MSFRFAFVCIFVILSIVLSSASLAQANQRYSYVPSKRQPSYMNCIKKKQEKQREQRMQQQQRKNDGGGRGQGASGGGQGGGAPRSTAPNFGR
jgi:choline-glycine betaine transporter